MPKDRKHPRKDEHKEKEGPLGTGMAEHARKSMRDRGDVINRIVDGPKDRKKND